MSSLNRSINNPVQQIDLSTVTSGKVLAEAYSAIEENHAHLLAIARAEAEKEWRMQAAMEQTAENTKKSNENLETIIYQQNQTIELQKELLAIQKKQLEALQNIFASDEDSVIVEKELMQLICSQIDFTHPLWEYVKDKGTDIAISGAPVLYRAFRTLLAAHGIVLP